jgi:hypothetical protein
MPIEEDMFFGWNESTELGNTVWSRQFAAEWLNVDSGYHETSRSSPGKDLWSTPRQVEPTISRGEAVLLALEGSSHLAGDGRKKRGR